MRAPPFREDICIAAVSRVMQQFPRLARGVPLPDAAGYEDSKLVSLTGLLLEGLDTISVTAGQPLSFVPREGLMTIPITFAAISVRGSIAVDETRGTFAATLREPGVIATISGLDSEATAAGDISIIWTAGALPDVRGDLGPALMTLLRPTLQLLIRGDISDVLTGAVPIDEQGRTLAAVLLAMLNAHLHNN